MQTLIDKLAQLKERADRLDKTIVKEKSKEAVYLPYAKNVLRDVQTIVLPSAQRTALNITSARWLEMGQFQLKTVETLLDAAEKMVAKFGPDFDTVG
jgi:hypothetical protein